MKRFLPVLACCMLPMAAAAQVPAAQGSQSPTDQSSQSNQSTPEPQNVHLKGDGRCVAVHPGDTVQYDLTIEGVAGAHAVYGDLRLRLGRSRDLLPGGLPAPDFRSLGGGGLGKHDESEGKIYHFAFTVPKELYGGVYRGVEVTVRAEEPPAPQQQSLYQPAVEYAPRVNVTRHTRDEVRRYCLNVFSSFGVASTVRPAVTNFQPGPVVASPPAPIPPGPLPSPK